MPYAYFFGLCLAIYFLSYQIMLELAIIHSQNYVLLRILLFPGIILHEVAHMIACGITFTPIHGFSLWDEQGGHVLHQKPHWPIITQPIISLAPFPVGIATLLWLSHYLTMTHWYTAILIFFLMVSIAGTLGPSKTDFTPAISGLVFLAIVFGTGYYFFPNVLAHTFDLITQTNKSLLLVTLILLIFWGIVHLFSHIIRRLRS